MADSLESDPVKSKQEKGNRAYNVISTIFLLIVFLLMCVLMLPFSKSKPSPEPIDTVITVDEVTTPDYRTPPVPYTEAPTVPSSDDVTTPGYRTPEPVPFTKTPTVLPPKRRPHPEEADEDDLPLLYRGLNPDRREKSRVLYRLPGWIRPLSYAVTLAVEVRGHNGVEQSTVEGTSLSTFKVEGEASNLLEIHGEGFKTITFESLKASDGANVGQIRQFYNEKKRVWSWLLERPLDGETYQLNLTWTGAVGHGIMGLYETWYFDGETNRYSLATQGEMMSTRRWMPCFDEPALKANLSLIMHHPSSLTARSNARILSTETPEGKNFTTTKFESTSLIPPYSYAFSLTDYLELKDTVAGFPISVVIPPTHAHHLNHSMGLAKKSMKFYLSALNATKVFDKMDFVFVPDHFSAMENPGHITLGLDHLDRYGTYAHEMMHQYFGNLVTLAWWDEVWINEALTTVYDIDAQDGIGTPAAIDYYQAIRRAAMGSDAFRKTIPLKFAATTEVEANANFQQKPYTKGAVVMLMLRNIVGEQAWKAGVEKFLDKFAFQAVEGEDFLRTIVDAATEFNQKSGDNGQTPQLTLRMARTFLENRGFPLVRLTRNGRTLVISQERFHRGFINGDQKENKERWAIPIHLSKLDGTPYRTFIMADQSLSIELDVDDAVILNPSKVVFYRAVYDEETYKKIVQSGQTPTADFAIRDDLLHAAQSGYVEPQLAYDVWFMGFSVGMPSEMYTAQLTFFAQMSTLFPNRLKAYLRTLKPSSNESEIEQLYERLYMEKDPNFCRGLSTEQDLMRAYRVNRTYQSFLCPQMLKTLSKDRYRELFDMGLDLSRSQTIHPTDFKLLLSKYKNIDSTLIADIVLEKAATMKDEFALAELIAIASHGFDARVTPQLRKIAELAPGAARQNAAMITRIFNERHAMETEDRLLGDKIEKAFREGYVKMMGWAYNPKGKSAKKMRRPNIDSGLLSLQKEPRLFGFF